LFLIRGDYEWKAVSFSEKYVRMTSILFFTFHQWRLPGVGKQQGVIKCLLMITTILGARPVELLKYFIFSTYCYCERHL